MYNILDLKFVQGLRVRDIAQRLAMSEADLYRKQKLAIEEVARTLSEMESNGTPLISARAAVRGGGLRKKYRVESFRVHFCFWTTFVLLPVRFACQIHAEQ
jgi:hypothetical protein